MNYSEFYTLPAIKEHHLKNTDDDEFNVFERIFDYHQYNFDLEKIKRVLQSIERKNNVSIKDEIIIKTYVSNWHFDSDDKYGFEIMSLWINQDPVAIIYKKNNDIDLYATNFTMIKQSLMKIIDDLLEANPSMNKLFDSASDYENNIEEAIPNDIMKDICQFYDQDLSFQKYENGDIVWAWILENQSLGNIEGILEVIPDYIDKNHQEYHGYILTKIKIHDFNKYNKQETYMGTHSCSEVKQSHIKDHSVLSIQDKAIIGKVDEIALPDKAIINFIDENGSIKEDYRMNLKDVNQWLYDFHQKRKNFKP